MLRLMRLVSPAFAMLVFFGSIFAADDLKEPGPLVPKDVLEKLKLTDDQKEKFAQVQKDYDERSKVILVKARAAFDKKDRKGLEKQKRAAEKLKEEMTGKLKEILNEDQSRQLPPPKVPVSPAGGPLPPLLSPEVQEKLTPEQKARLEKLHQERDAKAAQLQQEFRMKAKELLTEEQKKKLAEP